MSSADALVAAAEAGLAGARRDLARLEGGKFILTGLGLGLLIGVTFTMAGVSSCSVDGSA